jgi:glycosyltransferase involved in cell wall biosynthesis
VEHVTGLAAAKRAVRQTIGLWRARELVNLVALGLGQPAWRRFEDAEVARLAGSTSHRPVAAVATVIATYRRPDLLRRAVESALGQTVADQTVIVIDDGGGLAALPDDPRLVAVSLARNTGIAGLVRNVGIRLTRSRLVAFLDDDNEWHPNHLEVALAALDGRDGGPPADIVYTALDRRLPDGTALDTLGVPFDRRALADRSFIDTNAVVLRRSARVRFSVLPRRRTTMPREDWEFVYRLSRRATVRHVPVPTVRYLVNADSYFTDWRLDRQPGRPVD